MTGVTRILTCTFPFSDQDPPVETSSPCVECPNAARAVLDQHSLIARDDEELLETIRSFAIWLMDAGSETRIEEVVRYAADLYTRKDHTGTCVPKTVIFAVGKYRSLDSYGDPFKLTPHGKKAVLGEEVECWPTGERRRTIPAREMFYEYARRYDG